MSVSVYNEALKQKAKELKQFAEGEIQEVDLSGFKEISEQRAAALGRPPRKNWRRNAVVTEDGCVTTSGGKPITDTHVVCLGEVLYALGYTGPFCITKDLRLVKTVPATTTENITVDDIVAAALRG
jgi:hypothetical protein